MTDVALHREKEECIAEASLSNKSAISAACLETHARAKPILVFPNGWPAGHSNNHRVESIIR